MVDYAYTTVTGKIKPLLEKIRHVGVPQKVTIAWLKHIGHTSSNDASLIGVLKFVVLTDPSGIPSATWSAYRGASHRTVLGEAIRHGYADLFAIYPDAHMRKNAELIGVFSTGSKAGAQVISKTVQTFKALVDEADFTAAPHARSDTYVSNGPLHPPSATAQPSTPRAPDVPDVHIDIKIHISPESSLEQVNQIFENMARHLNGRMHS